MSKRFWPFLGLCSTVCAVLGQVASGGIDCTEDCGMRVRWREGSVYRKYPNKICFRTGVVDPAGGTSALRCEQDDDFNMTSKLLCNGTDVCNGAHNAEEASLVVPEMCEDDGTIIKRQCTGSGTGGTGE
jgi:hypothetical protein